MEIPGANRLAIILGAGASHDCVDRRTAAQVNDEYRPPLARDICAQRFDGILSAYSALTPRLDELRTQLLKNGNFEEIFRALLDSADRHQKYWPLQIPLYLRHLFWTISQDYFQGASKFDTLVRRVLEASFDKILFLNLNYDLFLDDALTNYDRHEFDALPRYIPQSKKWLYVKPHGSVNWARILENCPKYDNGIARPTALNEKPIFSSELMVVNWDRHHHIFYIPGGGPEGYPYPQLVIPTDRPKEFACPQDHINQAKTFLQACGNFLLIGFSGRDDDVVNLLQEIPKGSQLVIVSKGTESGRFLRFACRREARAVFKRMISRVPSLASKGMVVSFYDDGFSMFLESEKFDKFCDGHRLG